VPVGTPSEEYRCCSVAHSICHNLLVCGRYRLSRRKQIVEEYFTVSGDEEWAPRYNIAPTQHVPVIRQNPRASARELLLVRRGAHAVMGEGLVCLRQDDQREVGDGSHQARVPRRAEIPQVPGSRGRLL
jgi:putative SOS response-associated peptidase YedK